MKINDEISSRGDLPRAKRQVSWKYGKWRLAQRGKTRSLS